MSSSTSNLGLTKPAYSETADVNVLNTNMDLIDAESGKVRGNFSATYDSTASYAVGDWCLYEGVLYRCTTAIASGGEAWNSNHWSRQSIDNAINELNSKIATGTFTPSSLAELKSKILEYVNDMANGSMRSIAVYCGFNSAPFVNSVIYTGTISKYNAANLSVSLVSTTGVDVEMGYGNNTWTITSLSGNLAKVDLTSQCTWNSNLTFYSRRLTKVTNHMAVLQFTCDTSYLGANTEIVTLPISVDMFYAPAMTAEGNLDPRTSATIFRHSLDSDKILVYVNNPGYVFIGYVVLTF